MLQTPEPTRPSPPSPKAKPRRHAQWLELIARYQSSGLSEQAFCDSIEVRLDTFRKHRYQAVKASSKKVTSGFKPVKVVKAASGIVLHAAHCRLELPTDMAVVDIAALIKALGR